MSDGTMATDPVGGDGAPIAPPQFDTPIEVEGTPAAPPEGGMDLQKKNELMGKQIEELSKKAGILDSMLDDPRFQTWLASESGSISSDPTDPASNQPQPQPQQPDPQQSAQMNRMESAITKLQESNPEVADAMATLFQGFKEGMLDEVGQKVTGIESVIQKEKYDRNVQASIAQIEDMKKDGENYPMFNQVWNEMAKLLQSNRVSNLHDAYTVSVANTIPINRIAAKRNANMVEGGQSGLTRDVTNKIYKTPRDAAAAAINELGWGDY